MNGSAFKKIILRQSKKRKLITAIAKKIEQLDKVPYVV